MKLTAYKLPGRRPLDLRPAPVEREWMSATNDRFAYRCLPLDIANSHGWELLCPEDFSARWNKGQTVPDVTVWSASKPFLASSHFGDGILTFNLPYLFVTDPEFDLFIQGPINRPKDAISPLSAVVETDWLPFTFTMNWKFTRPNTIITFQKHEPFCHIFPVARGKLEHVQPIIKDLESDETYYARYHAWEKSRDEMLKKNESCPAHSAEQNWQKHYFVGKDQECPRRTDVSHRTKLTLKRFSTGDASSQQDGSSSQGGPS